MDVQDNVQEHAQEDVLDVPILVHLDVLIVQEHVLLQIQNKELMTNWIENYKLLWYQQIY